MLAVYLEEFFLLHPMIILAVKNQALAKIQESSRFP